MVGARVKTKKCRRILHLKVLTWYQHFVGAIHEWVNESVIVNFGFNWSWCVIDQEVCRDPINTPWTERVLYWCMKMWDTKWRQVF